MNRSKRPGPFFEQLDAAITRLGGMHNAHLHLDRACTLDDRYLEHAGHRILANSHVSLHRKHGLIPALHDGPAYDSDDLQQRVEQCLDVMVACNTVRADSLVDVTADRVGLSALRTMQQIQRRRAGEIELRLGAYSPLGFRDDEPERWEVLAQGAGLADFVAALPEADDTFDHPQHIGFDEHCRRMLLLARELGRPLHVHTDQRNEPSEDGTERLIGIVREVGAPPPPSDQPGEPMVWAVHMVSPSTYDDARWERMVAGLVEQRIGVICCPTAALGMRQLRPLRTPTGNSIPRVLELLAAGVHVRLGSDNIADICSPSTTADLTDEVLVLSAAIRYYDVEVLARLAAGRRLDAAGLAAIRAHLQANAAEIRKVLDARHSRAAR